MLNQDKSSPYEINIISTICSPELEKHWCARPSSNRELVLISAQVVCDYHQTWCQPCKALAPGYDRLAGEWHQVTFIRVDCDAVKPVAKAQNIEAYPTIVFYRNSEEVDRVRFSPFVLQGYLTPLYSYEALQSRGVLL